MSLKILTDLFPEFSATLCCFNCEFNAKNFRWYIDRDCL